MVTNSTVANEVRAERNMVNETKVLLGQPPITWFIKDRDIFPVR
jgi:hypothetical protein